MRRPVAARSWLPLAVLVAGALFVAAYDSLLETYRYPYSGDSASYIEMATSLMRDGRPLVTPWDVTPGDRDAVAQPLFPPGFPVLIAALTPIVGDARVAALIPARAAALLLPFLIVALFRGVVADVVLTAVAALTLVGGGVRDWHFVAYSDVPGLVLAVLALGALVRGLGLAGMPRAGSVGWLIAAGLATGTGYAMRNSGLAVIGAAFATLAYARLRGVGPARAPLYWSLAALVPVVPLLVYNLATFGRVQPYDMPASSRHWPANLADYATAQVADLGVPVDLVSHGPLLAGAALLAAGVCLTAAAWRLRRDASWQGLLVMLGSYVGAGATLLVVSRSRFEWGNLIDSRNVLQYSWAYALGLVIAVQALMPRSSRRDTVVAAVLAIPIAYLAVTAIRGPLTRADPEESWLTLSRDANVMEVARALPAETLVASNTAVLFRIGVPRPVRELEVGGDDRDFLGSLGELARATAGRRPAAFLLVCDEWTVRLSACGAATDDGGPTPACRLIRSVPPRVALCAVPGAEDGSTRPAGTASI